MKKSTPPFAYSTEFQQNIAALFSEQRVEAGSLEEKILQASRENENALGDLLFAYLEGMAQSYEYILELSLKTIQIFDALIKGENVSFEDVSHHLDSLKEQYSLEEKQGFVEMLCNQWVVEWQVYYKTYYQRTPLGICVVEQNIPPLKKPLLN